jgi:hypothetical protein
LTALKIVGGPGASGTSEDDLLFAADANGGFHYLGCFQFTDTSGTTKRIPLTDPAPGKPLVLVVDPVFVAGQPYISTGRLDVVPLDSGASPPPTFLPPVGGAGSPPVLFPRLTSTTSALLVSPPGFVCPVRCLDVALGVADVTADSHGITTRVVQSSRQQIRAGHDSTVALPDGARPAGLRVLLTLTGSPGSYLAAGPWRVTPG